MPKIVIVYHSGYGHTKKVAEAVLTGTIDAGADAKLLAVGDLDDAGWAELDAADAIIFGAPTYMGGPSADFKKFADASSKPWFAQSWKDKIAAGFTNSATMNGDNHSTIAYLVTLAMQHGMIWAGTGMMPWAVRTEPPPSGSGPTLQVAGDKASISHAAATMSAMES